MRVFALSDIHVDFEVNKQWIANLSGTDHQSDVLILAGDVCDSIELLEWCLQILVRRFVKVLYVPGNHELWVHRDQQPSTSLDKFRQVRRVAENCGVSMEPFTRNGLSIVPLLGWYDYSFGEPTNDLLEAWMDYRACRWPQGFSVPAIAEYLMRLNHDFLSIANETIISFSHFLPRLDLMPNYIPTQKRMLYPVLGSTGLEAQLRQLRPAVHVYGHSHVNRCVTLDGVRYVNNAFGYPHETSTTAKQLVCIYEDTQSGHSASS